MLSKKIIIPISIILTILVLAFILTNTSAFESSLTIVWTTESELDIIGFNIYRSDTAEGEYEKINDELIPPAADPFVGGEHTYVDETVTRGQTYYYQLETIGRNGNTTRTDPIELTAGG